jgi:hypothetical protein
MGMNIGNLLAPHGNQNTSPKRLSVFTLIDST